MGNWIMGGINLILGILNIILILKNTCIQKRQGQFTSLIHVYAQIQNSINTLSTKLSNGVCIKGIFGLEILDKRLYAGNGIDYSEIQMLCSKLKKINANIELFCKTNYESSIEKDSKLVFYKLVEQDINQIIQFYELIIGENILIHPNIHQVGGTDEDDKSCTENLRQETEQQKNKLEEIQKKYCVK